MFEWKKTIHLCRGIAGSGKTTLGLKLVDGNRDRQVENDDFCLLPVSKHSPVSWLALHQQAFDRSKHPSSLVMDPEVTYGYESRMTHLAGQWCGAEAFRRLRRYDSVAVSNTFILRRHILLYLEEARVLQVKVRLHIPTTPWAFNPEECFKRNLHGVPLETLVKWVKDFEPMTQQEVDVYLGIFGTEHANT